RALPSPAWGAAGATTFGRGDAGAGAIGNDTRSTALPAITGRRAVSLPPAASSAVQSAARPTPSFAATRGARSRPIDDALNSTTFAAAACTAAATAAA